MNPKMTAADASRSLGVTIQLIHKKLRRGLDFKKSANRVYFGHDVARKIYNYKFDPKVVCVQIVKGGTGKTSLTNAIAVRSSLYGARVLCIDGDQQGNLTQSFGMNITGRPVLIDAINNQRPFTELVVPIIQGLDIIPSKIDNVQLDNTLIVKRLPLDKVFKHQIDALKASYDLIIIDCPPALVQSVTAWSLASDIVISPIDPEEFSLTGLEITNRELDNIERNYGLSLQRKIVLNKFDHRTQLSHRILMMLMAHEVYQHNLFGSYVRVSQDIPNALSRHETIYDCLRPSSAKEDIDLMVQELLEIGQYNKSQTNEPITVNTLSA